MAVVSVTPSETTDVTGAISLVFGLLKFSNTEATIYIKYAPPANNHTHQGAFE